MLHDEYKRFECIICAAFGVVYSMHIIFILTGDPAGQ